MGVLGRRDGVHLMGFVVVLMAITVEAFHHLPTPRPHPHSHEVRVRAQNQKLTSPPEPSAPAPAVDLGGLMVGDLPRLWKATTRMVFASLLPLTLSLSSALAADPATIGTKKDRAYEKCLSLCIYSCTKPKDSDKTRVECLVECKPKCATTKEQLLKGAPKTKKEG